MCRFLSANAPAVQAILTFVLVTITAVYVWLTSRISDASAKQAEALHKPVLTLQREEFSPPKDHDLLDDVWRTKLSSPISITNIGAGPALFVKWSLVRQPEQRVIQGFIPYIEAGKSVSTHFAGHISLSSEDAMMMQLVCRYESLSKTAYVSETTATNMKIDCFKVSVNAGELK